MIQVNSFTFDQVVQINGILGYVDFIGEDITILIDAENNQHIIENRNIREAYSTDNVRTKDESIYYIN